MKQKKINRMLYMLVFILLTGIFSCADEREGFIVPEPAREFTFSVSLPVPQAKLTYALTAGDENKVGDVYVLVFKHNGTAYLLSDWVEATGIQDDGASNKKKFTAKFTRLTQGDAYKFVLIANAKSEVEALFTSGVTVGAERNLTLAKLQVKNASRWVETASGTGYRDIPMWGETSADQVLSANMTISGIPLVRMLARINVRLTTPAAKANFKLKNVRLYNYNDRGQVAPNTSTWTGTPSVPASAQKPAVPTASALLYSSVNATQDACTNEIYTFESNRGTSATHLNNTCLVVGGRYTGDTADSYYRIDFANTTGGSITYNHLLRNHSYEVNITGVGTPGLPTPDDAFKLHTVKIQADILAWNDGGMSDVVSDGQHKLGVSQGEFTFTREARTATSPDNVLSITTDVPSGWKVLKIIDASNTDVNIDTNPSTGWIRLSPNNKNNAGSLDTRILLNENTSGASRTAKIHINAGRLTYVVTVTQNTAAALMLTLRDAATNTIDITDLVFASAAGVTPAQQSVKLSWMPVDKAVDVDRFQVGSNPFFAYAGGDQLGSLLTSITDPSGVKSLTVQPPAMTAAELTANPFLEKISKIDFTVFNGTNYLTKSLFLRQFVYNFLVEETTGFYRLDGSTYILRVKSNTGWKISSIVESTGANTILNLAASDNLRTTTSGGTTPSSGLDIQFRVTTNASLRGTLTVKFASTDSPVRFAEKTLVLSFNEAYPAPHNGWAGSNIYWDGSKLTFDDVSASPPHQNYQGVFFQWGSLWGIAPNGAHNSAWSNSIRVYKTGGGSYSEVQNVAWSSIPRIPDATNVISYPPSGKSERDRAYLYELSDEANGRGDICKFLTKMGYAPGSPATKWRMPTSNEFEGTYGVSGSWGNQTSNSPSGMYDNPGRPGYSKAAIPVGAYPSAFFPASGYRNYNGQLLGAGDCGFYWSGSPLSTFGFYLDFDVDNKYYHRNTYRFYGYSVRCVRE